MFPPIKTTEAKRRDQWDGEQAAETSTCQGERETSVCW